MSARQAKALSIVIVVGALVTGSVRAADQPFPDLDSDKVCHVQADYAFAATLGQTDVAREFAACRKSEGDGRLTALTLWHHASDKDAADCLPLAEGSYRRLARCLEDGVSLRTAR